MQGRLQGENGASIKSMLSIDKSDARMANDTISSIDPSNDTINIIDLWGVIAALAEIAGAPANAESERRILAWALCAWCEVGS